MKTFVVLLLLANGIYFGWNQGWLRDLPAVPVNVTSNSVADLPAYEQAPATLVLLSELPEPSAPLPAINRQPDSGAQAEGSELTPEVPVEGSDLTQDVAENVPETGLEAPEVLALSPDLPAVPALPPTLVPWCAELGLFAEESEARRLIPTLNTLGFAVELESGRVPVSSTFWVYMSAFPSEAEAFRVLEELQDRDIDSYYMRTGNMAGGISLGVFSRKGSAEVAQANLSRQGYETQISEVFREEPRFRLVLNTPDASILEGPEWQGFRAENSALQLSENVCEMVASSD